MSQRPARTHPLMSHPPPAAETEEKSAEFAAAVEQRKAAPILSDVANRVKREVDWMAERVKAGVRDGVAAVEAGIQDVTRIQWRKEVKSEVVGGAQAVQKAAAAVLSTADAEVRTTHPRTGARSHRLFLRMRRAV